MGDDLRIVVGDGWIPLQDFFYREVENRKMEFQPPEGTHIVRLVSEDARALEHLTGIMNDLEATARYCTLYESSFKDELDPGIQEALWKAALITYARCFEKGIRSSERPDLSVLDAIENARTAHDYFLALRSKYVAHSVNALETNITYALVTTVHGKLVAARGPVSFQISSNPLDDVGTDTLRRLAETLLAEARSRHDDLLESVTADLHAMTHDELAALPPLTEHQAPGVAHIGRTRK